jgi:hypothetical protein
LLLPAYTSNAGLTDDWARVPLESVEVVAQSDSSGQTEWMNAEEMLGAGNSILAEVLLPAGFALGKTGSAKGSGGHFATAKWTRDAQFIELHFRYALGIVRYGWDEEAFDHRQVVGALVASASYPGFSDDPLGGFRHLAQDLSGPLSRILGAENREVLQLARAWTPPGRVLP